jgi:hypothetical protein
MGNTVFYAMPQTNTEFNTQSISPMPLWGPCQQELRGCIKIKPITLNILGGLYVRNH